MARLIYNLLDSNEGIKMIERPYYSKINPSTRNYIELCLFLVGFPIMCGFKAYNQDSAATYVYIATLLGFFFVELFGAIFGLFASKRSLIFTEKTVIVTDPRNNEILHIFEEAPKKYQIDMQIRKTDPEGWANIYITEKGTEQVKKMWIGGYHDAQRIFDRISFILDKKETNDVRIEIQK